MKDQPAESAAFMRVEYEALQGRRKVLDEWMHSRTTAFMTLVSILSGGLALLHNALDTSTYVLVAAVTVLAVLVVGLLTWVDLVDTQIKYARVLRLVNRARRYFADYYPAVQDYLPYTAGDDEPSYTSLMAKMHSPQRIVAVLCALLIGVLCTLALYAVARWPRTEWMVAALAVVLTAVAWAILEVANHALMLRGERQFQPHFSGVGPGAVAKAP